MQNNVAKRESMRRRAEGISHRWGGESGLLSLGLLLILPTVVPFYYQEITGFIINRFTFTNNFIFILYL